MVTSGRMPASVDTLRIGETILLGVDTLTREPTLGLHLDAFTVSAPVIECLVKPSLPRGTSAQDAFGNFPTFSDRGERRRAICALGRQDAPPEGLTPVDPRVEVLGASSDHLILDVDALDRPPRARRAHHASCPPTLRRCSCSRHPTSTKCSLRRPDTRIVARRDLQPQE